jgi:hypothetical protein
MYTTSMHRYLLPLVLILCTALPGGAAAAPASDPESIRFAVVGDTGTADKYQYAVAKQMLAEYDRAPFGFMLMLGDNLYGSSCSKLDSVVKDPYRSLLDKGVSLHATLGNHDQPCADAQMTYAPLHMGGKRFYSFAPAGDLVEFFTFDSTLLVEKGSTEQISWLEKALKESKARWKIVYLHHPPFSPGKRHGDNPILIERLVPVLEKGGVRIVMSGHEHFFAKMKERNGIDYIISGSGGKIHNGGIQPDPDLEFGNDRIHQFLSVTLTKDAFTYVVIGETGSAVYHGSIPFAANGAKEQK